MSHSAQDGDANHAAPMPSPGALLERAPDFATARSALLRTEYVHKRGWETRDAEPAKLAPTPRREGRPPPPPFALHETFDLPDLPPVDDGTRCSSVHRFVLTADAAA